jgi:hypothetical protein
MASKHGGSLPKKLREARRAEKRLARQQRRKAAGTTSAPASGGQPVKAN